MRLNEPFDDAHLRATYSRLQGHPYDTLYEQSDSAVYCSELIQKLYFTLQGAPLFDTIPMEFRNAQGQIPQYWTDLYAHYGRTVPEGEPGTNPGQLSRCPRLKVVGWLKRDSASLH